MKKQTSQSTVETETDEWYKDEFSTATFGDKRLSNRLIRVAKNLSEHPTMPINQASGDWSSTKGAYRFFDNEKVTPESILNPHFENTVNRMRHHEVVLSIQDTTSFNYSSHEALKLGPIGKAGTNGIMQHNTFAVSGNGLPLGLLNQITWVRPPLSDKALEKNQELYLEEREIYRWIQSLENSVQRAQYHPKMVSVNDRESDFYEFYDRAESLNALYLIRLKHNREIEEYKEGAKSYLKSQPVVATYEVCVPRRKGEYPERIATVELRYAPMTVCAPEEIESEVVHDAIKMYGIHVKEINPPSDVEPIEWFLVTNVAVLSIKDAMERIRWYLLRWMVEIYHKSEKSCCSSEGCRLETEERMLNFLAVNSVIAWRVLFITYIARQEPEAPAEVILSPTEVKVLEGANNLKLPKPKKIKTVKQAVAALAKLGGHMGRKNDKEPGIITVCRGMMRLNDFMNGFLLSARLRG
jgi:Transposase DNA-binding/Transposase Tn5 dimerisation domain